MEEMGIIMDKGLLIGLLVLAFMSGVVVTLIGLNFIEKLIKGGKN